MMQTLRKKARYMLYIALAGFLGLIFFQWGLNITGIRQKQRTDIAEIDGTQISYRDYISYARMLESRHRNISDEEIWDSLVTEIMLGKLISEEKLRVTDKELWEIIRSNPPREIYESEYMKNEQGEFDFNKYYELLRAPQSRSTWLAEYEYNLRQQIPKEKLNTLLSTIGWVSAFEDSVLIAGLTTIYDITYFSIPYYRAHKLVDVSDQELLGYYRKHKEEFKRAEQKIMKYVFFKKQPSHYDSLEARERLEDFKLRIEEGEDFLEVAREVSDDTAIVRSFEDPARLKPYLANTYDELANSEVSDIIQATGGYEIVKRVHDDLIYVVRADIVVSPTTVGEISDHITSFKETAQAITFDSAAVEFELLVRRSLPMAIDNITFPVRSTDVLARFLEKSDLNDIGGPFRSIGGYYVVAIDSIIPAVIPELEAVKPRVMAEVEKGKLENYVDDYLTNVHAQLTAGTSMEEIAATDTLLMYRQQGNINLQRMRTIISSEVAGIVATLEPGDLSNPLMMDWAGYVIRCDNKTTIPFDSSMVYNLQYKRQIRLTQLWQQVFTPENIVDYRDEFYE